MKFKLKRKDTGLSFNQWVQQEEKFYYDLGHKFMVGMNCDGFFFYCDMGQDYEGAPTKFLKKEEWHILMATEKVYGRWNYFTVE